MIKAEISGLITRIIYKTSNYCIFSVDDVMTVTTKGKNNHYIEDTYIKVKGNQIISEKYGQQIEANSIDVLPIPGSFIYFLIKKKVSYVGEKTIEKLKKAFGDDLLDFLKKDPERVKKVINNIKGFDSLITYFQKREEKLKNIRIIDKYNIDPAYLEKIFKAYEENICPAFCKKLFKDYDENVDSFDHFKSLLTFYKKKNIYSAYLEKLIEIYKKYDEIEIEKIVLFDIQRNPYLFVKYGIPIHVSDKISKIDGKYDEYHNFRREAWIYKKLCIINQNTFGYCLPFSQDIIDDIKFIKNFYDPNALNELTIYNGGIILKLFDEREKKIYDCITNIQNYKPFFRNNIENSYESENSESDESVIISTNKQTNFIDLDETENFETEEFENSDLFKLENFESEEPSTILTDEQTNFIELAYSEPVTILTGGPGTGKSTTIKYLVNELLKTFDKKNIMVSALCGVAVNNIDNIIGQKTCSATLHRIFYNRKYKKSDFEKQFLKSYNDDNSFKNYHIKVLIIDEMSLVDIGIFADALFCLKNLEKLILLGDPNQLPSISSGQVLIDLLKVKSIPHIRLTRVQRQNGQSLIIDNAKKIISGASNLIYDGKQCSNRVDVNDSELLYYYKNEKSVHVVTLTNNESDRINDLIQSKVNENKLFCYEIYGKKFKLGDKVKQKVNNYKLGVFNGEIGVITDISETYIIVDYNFNKTIEYRNETIVFLEEDPEMEEKKKRLEDNKSRYVDQINLAYSTTIHSTQGNEYDIVFIILNGCKTVINRNVIYTALTRAKKHAIIIGSRYIINYGVEKKYENRPTFLVERFD